MKLSDMERIAYDAMVKASPEPVSIDDLLRLIYKARTPPFNARGSVNSMLRQLARKADAMDLPFIIQKVSHATARGEHQAVRRTQRRTPRAKGAQRQAV